MGFSQTWLAVKGRSPDSVLRLLGLERTGESEEIPESAVTGAALPDGWYLVVANNESGHPFLKESVLTRMSAGSDVVTCEVEEHVMVSRATLWRDGRQIWAVEHNSELGLRHLDVQGEPPASLVDVRDRLFAMQDADPEGDVDYTFDIPVEIADLLTGYRHDKNIAVGVEEPYEVLRASDKIS